LRKEGNMGKHNLKIARERLEALIGAAGALANLVDAWLICSAEEVRAVRKAIEPLAEDLGWDE
jgi:hypothetical protein